MLDNRTHCKQDGQQGKGSGSYFDSAVVATSYSCLSVPWSFAVLPSHFEKAHLFFNSIISFLAANFPSSFEI